MFALFCRQRGLLQGSVTLRGIDQVRDSLKQMHANYQDLKYRVNMAAEEVRIMLDQSYSL